MSIYYKVDSRRLTFGEYWNFSPNAKVLLPWLLKILRIQIPLSQGLRRIEQITEYEVAASTFPPEVAEKLDKILCECQSVGFHSPRYYCIDNPFDGVQVYFVSLLHDSGECVARLMCSVAQKISPPHYTVLVTYLSDLADGTFLVSSNQRKQMESTPEARILRVVGAGPKALLDAHQKQLAAITRQTPLRPLGTQEECEAASNRYEVLAFDFNVRRGVNVPMSEEEIALCHQQVAVAQEAGPEWQPHAPVLQEIGRLQEKKPGWGNALWLLGITLLLFVAVGSQQWSWKTALLLVPILLIHELGHYLAMKAFNYRNLRLFFIPFFGAAVTGKNYNVPGWQKAIVFLMGPLPGIFLGAILGSAGMMFQIPFLTQTALMMLILNGFNLLPVLPLDGGWILHSVLFCRNYRLDFAFKIFAIVALLAFGFLGISKIMMYIAIPLALGLPTAYRLAKITGSLRENGLASASSDNQNIPPEIAIPIIDKVKSAFPGSLPSRAIAEHVLTVFESLNARPPGWILSGAILATHAVGVLMALALAAVFMFGGHGRLPFDRFAKTPALKHAVSCGAIERWQSNAASNLWATPQCTIIASSAKSTEIDKLFESFKTQAPPVAEAVRFGATVMFALPETNDAARKEWLHQARSQMKDAFVETSNSLASVRLTCVAPNEEVARQIQNEVDQYLEVGLEMYLLPPWAKDDLRTAEEKEQHARARKTYQQLVQAKHKFWNSPESEKLSKAMVQARKDGDSAEVEKLRKAQKQLIADMEKLEVEKLQKSNDPALDTNLIALYAALPPQEDNRELSSKHLKMGQSMGQLPLTNGKPQPKELQYLPGFALASREGNKLTFLTSFRSVSAGLPALTEWLCARSCSAFHYDVSVSPLGDDEPEP